MFHIHKSQDGQFYFTLTGWNGQVLVTSETYKQKYGAKKGIERVIALSSVATKHRQIMDHTTKTGRNAFKPLNRP